MKTIEKNNNLISRSNFSKKINIGVDTLKRWEKEGKIPFLRLGKQVRYRMSDVQDFLKNTSNDVKNEKFLSRKELADRWGFCIETLKRWEKKKKLPYIKVVKQVRYLLSEVEKIEKKMKTISIILSATFLMGCSTMKQAKTDFSNFQKTLELNSKSKAVYQNAYF